MNRSQLRLIFAAITLSLLLSACNTIEGAGKDLRKAGEAVEQAAKRAKND